MKFENKIKARIYLMSAYAVIGVILCVLGYTRITSNDMLTAWGIALFAGGTVHIIRNIRLMKNSKKMQALEIAERDERNIMLREKARSLAFGIYLMIMGLAVGVMLLLNKSFGVVIAYNICTLVLIYCICYWVIRRKY
ncbi:MAG: hypothetical protein J1F64_11275 [Oscillospiraceae bacterium]|nr:hypothetical protein [Oscillospiraceae bacterium]